MIDLFTNPDRWADMATWENEALRLHAEGTVHRVEAPGYAPFWAVIGHDAVMAVERDAKVFANAPRPVLGTIEREAKIQREMKALIHMDGEQHSSHRRLATDFFKPGGLGRLDARLEELSAAALAKLRCAH